VTFRSAFGIAVIQKIEGQQMLICGYARVSTADQVAGLEAQERDLRATGCTKIFIEKVSSVAQRDQLAAALSYVREGDTLCVTKLDRLCRSVADLVAITEALRANGVALRILSINLDTSTPTGKLMLNLLGSIAEFERELMLERQREGIAKAKADGKYLGRVPTARRMASQVHDLRSAGVRPSAIASSLSMSRSSVYRILASAAA
jgi:DNA invertase Pin-like site-specific DNA recombinase